MFATLQSVPRTAQAAWWGAEAGLAYKRLMSRYADHDSQECKDALSHTHHVLAQKLLRVCQSNGGVYIKAAQTFSTIQAIPKEYRKYAPICVAPVIACRTQAGHNESLPHLVSRKTRPVAVSMWCTRTLELPKVSLLMSSWMMSRHINFKVV